MLMSKPSDRIPERKLQVVLTVWRGELPATEAARRADVAEQTLHNWKRALMEEATTARPGAVVGARREHGVCVLAGYVARDNTWPCWIGAGTGDELKARLKERFDSDPVWKRAILLSCQTSDEAASMATALTWMMSAAPNPVLAEPTPKPVLALEAVMCVLGLSGDFTHDPLGQSVWPTP